MKKLNLFLMCGLLLTAMFLATGCEDNKPDDPPSPSYGVIINGIRWATCNLASHGTFVENPEDFGGLFQWGRRGDGHEQRNSPTTSTLSTSDVPGHGHFIVATAWPWDWRSPQNHNLWGNPKTANDPCPQGWRVPTDTELQTLTDTNNVSSEWTILNGVNGRTFTDRNTGNTLFLPAAGWRINTDPSNNTGTNGYYWSSTPVAGTAPARRFNFSSSDANMNVSIRVSGFSVRCVAE